MVVGLDPQIREILACPCPAHGKLHDGTAADPEADALTCTVCGRSFPVTDGIPVLLLNEALPGTGPDAGQTEDRLPGPSIDMDSGPDRASGPDAV